MATLAPELVDHIVQLLDPLSLLRAGAVCRAWREVVSSDSCLRQYYASHFPLYWRYHLSTALPDIGLRDEIVRYLQVQRYFATLIPQHMRILRIAKKRDRDTRPLGLERMAITTLRFVFSRYDEYYHPDLFHAIFMQLGSYVPPMLLDFKPARFYPSALTELAALLHDGDTLAQLLGLPKLKLYRDRAANPEEFSFDPAWKEEPIREDIVGYYIANPTEDLPGFTALMAQIKWKRAFRPCKHGLFGQPLRDWRHPYLQNITAHHMMSQRYDRTYPLHIAIAKGHTGYVQQIWGRPEMLPPICTIGLPMQSKQCPSDYVYVAVQYAQPKTLQYLLHTLHISPDCTHGRADQGSSEILWDAFMMAGCYQKHHEEGTLSLPCGRTYPDVMASLAECIRMLIPYAASRHAGWWWTMFYGSIHECVYDIAEMFLSQIALEVGPVCCEDHATAQLIKKLSVWDRAPAIAAHKLLVRYGWLSCAPCRACITLHAAHLAIVGAPKAMKPTHIANLEFLFAGNYDAVVSLRP